jgi:uncharacterized protein (TIGR00290 family)
MQKAIACWSGGKDSALALMEARKEWEIQSLLTTVTEDYDRISMHGVRRELLELQAEAIGLALDIVLIPSRCTNEDYELRMRKALTRHLSEGVKACIFGDIYLQDVRKYREEKLLTVGLEGLFPIWGADPAPLARRFIDLGFKSVLCCVDTQQLDGSFAGRLYDERLLADLPPTADPCGERGEFHTFVFDGPIFCRPVAYRLGERVLRDGRFAYCDLLP